MSRFSGAAWIAALTFPLALAPRLGAQPSTTDTRLLTEPAISGTRIAFAYDGDLWTANVDGSVVRRLTTADGDESNPAFSPDGNSIAFSANYDGNIDVYVIPAAGGIPQRLTWHPGRDEVQGFTPDGKNVTFTSQRSSYTNRYTQLYEVPLDGGMPSEIPLPNVATASWSPNGNYIAYNPISAAFQEWKHYRGGRASEIWIYDVKSKQVVEIPQPEGRSNDVDARWIGDQIYFRSDRDGEFNVYSYDPASKRVDRLTNYTDFPVLSLNADPAAGTLILEHAGWLYTLDPRTETAATPARLTIGVAADLRERRPRFVSGARYVRNAALSPSGARAVFEYRGEIITVPASKGDARNLTNSTNANDRSPAWSPDGSRIAYVSDESGEYKLVIEPQDGRGERKTYALTGHGFYSALDWSPDGRKIAYEDNSQSTYIFDVRSGKSSLVGGNAVYGPTGISLMSHAWSPDSRWLAYTVNTQSLVNTLFLYDVEKGESHHVTDGLSEVTSPAFDRSGKYLYVFASTDAGPVMDWFSQASIDFTRTRNIYAIVLAKSLPNPLARESDEEKIVLVRDSSGADSSRADSGRQERVRIAPPAPPRGTSGATRVDFDGIEYRILALPIDAAQLSELQTGEAGQIYYVRSTDGDNALHHYDLVKRKDEVLVPNINGYLISADGKKLMYGNRGNWFISPVGKVAPNEGRLAVADIQVKIDPREEWTQIFDEAWRINRDYFYAPNMHGVDWNKNREKYAQFLPALANRSDLSRVIQWMMSELSVGHHRGGGGDRLEQPVNIPGGLLGADIAESNGRYRITRVFGGLNWNPEMRAPLTEPGVNAREGEYILAVNGVDLRAPANFYAAFENTAGKIVDLSIGPNPDGSGARTVQVVPIANESALRNRAWVEGNLRKVDSATNGRVAYVYVPNTGGAGHDYFKRYFYPQANKDGIIVDERFNGGGSYADYYIDILRRPQISYWAMRYGADLRSPTAAIQGPKAMLIDETAGSGGDMLPWMFRNLGLGPLIGKRTWGGLVGILGFPTLMDGGTITAPNFAIWVQDSGWVVENVGVPPDIDVDMTPALVMSGRDPQLERAIAYVLEELKKHPPVKPKRPAYPDKVIE
jgi:tricorn protease